jgi:hypothetical protein
LSPHRTALAAFAIYALTSRGVTSGDDAVHLATAIAIVERGETTLAIDPGQTWVASRWTAGSLIHQDDDGLRSSSPPGLAILALPFVAIGSFFAQGDGPAFDPLFREGGAPRAVIRPLQSDPRVIAFSLLFPFCAALAVYFSMRAMIALGGSQPRLAIASSVLAIGSPLFAYAGTCWTQVPLAAALAFAIWRCALGARERSFSIGAAIAVAGALRYEAFAFALPLAFAIAMPDVGWRARAASIARFLAPTALSIALLAVHGFPSDGGGYSLERLPIGAFGSIFSPEAGLAIHAPFVLVALRSRALRAIVLSWTALALTVYGGWFDWQASLAYGPRFLVPFLPGFSVLLCTAIENTRTRVTALACGAIGAVLALPAALVAHVRIDERDPFALDHLVAAWRALGEPERAIGNFGVDCASSYVPAYALAAAIALALIARRGQSGPSRTPDPYRRSRG